MVKVTILVPVYNEEEMLPLFLKKADELFVDDKDYSYSLLFVNDGSKDRTLDILRREAEKRDNLSYISFSRNFGQDPALEAGLKVAGGEVVIPMDCDLQDPPELIRTMLAKYREGYDIVQPQRSARKGDSFMKKTTSKYFYKVLNHIAGREVLPPNVSQFKLLSRKAVDALNAMPENMRLIRSEVPYIGFKTCFVPFERHSRAAGKTKYNYKKMFNLAFHTITASTYAPLEWLFKFALAEGGFSLIGFAAALTAYIIGWAGGSAVLFSYREIITTWLIIFAVFLAIGMLALLLGIFGFYLKDIGLNTQRRPSYIIEERHDAPKTLKEKQR